MSASDNKPTPLHDRRGQYTPVRSASHESRAGPLIRSVAPAGIIDASDCSDRDSNRKSASTEMSSGRSATSEVEDHRPNHAWLAPGPVRWSSIMRIRAAAYGVAGVRSITIRTMFALNEICIKRMVDT